MSSSNPPLEVFLIRSYFNKSQVVRPPVPKSWSGFKEFPIKTFQNEMHGPLSSLALLRPSCYKPVGLKSAQIWLESLVRMTVEVDWHLITKLVYEPTEGPNPHRYTLEINEDAKSYGSVTKR